MTPCDVTLMEVIKKWDNLFLDIVNTYKRPRGGGDGVGGGGGGLCVCVCVGGGGGIH